MVANKILKLLKHYINLVVARQRKLDTERFSSFTKRDIKNF